MAIGDLIPSTLLARPVELFRFRGELTDPEMSDGFANSKLFQSNFRPGRRFRAPEPLSWLRRARQPKPEAPTHGRLVSLRDLIEAHHDVTEFGTEFGSESVAVPFPHVVLLGSFDERLERVARRDIRQMLDGFARYVDDLTEMRVLCRGTDSPSADELALFFGSGVFVPDIGEEPQGHVLISDAGSGDGMPPGQRVSDIPVLPGRLPAAFYRGQAAVAFSTNPGCTPATVGSLLPDDEAAWFYLAAGRHDPAKLELNELGRRSGMTSHIYLINRLRADGDEDAFEVVCTPRDGGPTQHLMVHAKRDARPSRLHRTSPPGPYLEIIGFLAPADRDSPDRWWIDLDHQARVIGVAGVPRASSIVVERRRLRRYDWDEMRFARRDEQAYKAESTRIGQAECVVLREARNRPFGYIALPDTATAVTFDARWWAASERYALDWLDFSGAVVDSADPDQCRGLAAATDSGPVRIPGSRETNMGAWPVRRHGTSSFVLTSTLGVGDELIVGPLVLRVPET